MSAVMKQDDNTPAMSEAALVEVLSSSLYPGAEKNSVVMVLAYCQAAHLDPMLKPVHIVPIWNSKTKKMQDTVMPGIGLYRIQAARTGQYAGISEPEYGPPVTAKLSGVEVTYPEWCRVTVKRQMSNGLVAEYTANERWLENYATSSKDTAAPNAMWKRRAFAQLAKCAEAQALRKAFPEVGSAPTADEMEGKTFEEAAKDVSPARQVPPEPDAKPAYPDELLAENIQKWQPLIDAGRTSPEHIIANVISKYSLRDEQANLEAAKAAFFASGGTTQFIRPGVGKDTPGISHEAKRPYGYARIAPKTKRGRIITPDDEVVICAHLMECKKAGMSRYKASKHVGISETLCRRLIAKHSLDFPKAG